MTHSTSETIDDITGMVALIGRELADIVAEKGLTLPPISPVTVFLDGSLPIDSLDLATLLVVLERRLGRDPFRTGFRQFRTVGDLAALYLPCSP